MDDRPIGMFDSGFGGLTVARALIDLMPHEHLVYLGDTARYPYGPRPLEEVAAFAHQIAEELVLRRGVKLLVVACNTASAAALESLSDRFDVPVVGVIEPGARSLLDATRTGRIGVIGTVGTIASGAYQRSVAAHAARRGAGAGGAPGEPAAFPAPEIELVALACPGFVEFVERGEFDGQQVRVLSERLLAPALEAKVDSLLLGCTHYPYLARTIGEVVGRDVVLVSSADETAFEVRRLLMSSGAASGRSTAPAPTFVTTGDVNRFEELGRTLLGPELERAERVEL